MKHPSISMTPTEIAKLIISQCDDNATAMAKMVVWIERHPDWEKAHLPAMRAAWVGTLLSVANADQRRSLANQVGQSAVRGASNSTPRASADAFVRDLAGAVQRNHLRMMDMPLWGGKRLRDATPDEIRASAEQYRTRGSTMLRLARFQTAVAEKAAAADMTKPIGSTMSADEIDALWEASDGE